jgi:RecJ-like exonuclease
MLMDVECPDCNGNGEVCGVNPNRRSRFVGHDDLSPDDFTVDCPRCLGTGTVLYDMEEDCEDE